MAENDLNTKGYVPTGSNTVSNSSVGVGLPNQKEIDKEIQSGGDFLQTNIPATIDGQVNPNVDYRKIFTGTSGTSFYDNPNFKKDIENATSFNSNVTLSDKYAPLFQMSEQEFRNSVANGLKSGNPIMLSLIHI